MQFGCDADCPYIYMTNELQEHMKRIGKIGGSARTPNKARTAKENLIKANAARLKRRAIGIGPRSS